MDYRAGDKHLSVSKPPDECLARGAINAGGPGDFENLIIQETVRIQFGDGHTH